MDSPWNRPDKALDAFAALIERLPVKHVLISYSNESIVDQDALLETARSFGPVTIDEIDYKRNVMSQIGNAKLHAEPEKGQTNKELLIMIRKSL